MFQIRFNDIIFSSNRKKISNSKIVLFFYGLGCSSTDLSFLLKQTTKDTQILIAELPGHNNLAFSQIDILSYSRTIYVFLKKNRIKEITFFAHSIGGIIPIILVKNFIKKKILIKNFFNYEGNLILQDTEMLTKKTISYNKTEFIKKKFNKLILKCKNSNSIFLKLWSISLIKTSPNAFYDLSKQCVELSRSNDLIKFFKTFFKNKVYIRGEYTKNNISEHLFGSMRYTIKKSGHFAFYENKHQFLRTFNQLILKK